MSWGVQHHQSVTCGCGTSIRATALGDHTHHHTPEGEACTSSLPRVSRPRAMREALPMDDQDWSGACAACGLYVCVCVGIGIEANR